MSIMDDSSLKIQSSPQSQLVRIAFAELRKNAQKKKKSVLNLIKAYQFRYTHLFLKTISSLKTAQNYQYKLLQFRKFKNGIKAQNKDILHSTHLVETQRLRRGLKIWLRKVQEKRKDEKNKRMAKRYKEYSLKERIFNSLKMATLVQRFSQKRKMAEATKMKRLFVAKFKMFVEWKRNEKERQIEKDKLYQQRLLLKYFDKWKVAPIASKYQHLQLKLKHIYFKQLNKCIRYSRKQSHNIVATYEHRLIKKSFNALVHNSIDQKITRYYNFKHSGRVFSSWKMLVERRKQQESQISPQVIGKIKYLSEFSLKLGWFNRMRREYERRTTNRQKDEAIRGYYALKTEEIIYKKYFYAFVENRNINRADRYLIHKLKQKTLNSFKLALKYRKRMNRLHKKAEQFQIKRLLAKSFTVLMIPVEKSRTAVEWHRLCKKKLFLEKWVQSAVKWYLQNQEKADKFYRFNMYFRVLLGFKQNVDFNSKTMDVIKMRVARRMTQWRKVNRVEQFERERKLVKVAAVFRGWKFYVRY